MWARLSGLAYFKQLRQMRQCKYFVLWLWHLLIKQNFKTKTLRLSYVITAGGRVQWDHCHWATDGVGVRVSRFHSAKY
mgnify:CR=1 FL=1